MGSNSGLKIYLSLLSAESIQKCIKNYCCDKRYFCLYYFCE